MASDRLIWHMTAQVRLLRCKRDCFVRKKGKITEAPEMSQTITALRGKRKTEQRREMHVKGQRNTCVCVCVCHWNVAILIWKNRDFLFVLRETREKAVGGWIELWIPAKTNSKLLWGLKWVPINHPLLSWELFHLEFYTFQKLPLRDTRTGTDWHQSLTSHPDSLLHPLHAASTGAHKV